MLQIFFLRGSAIINGQAIVNTLPFYTRNTLSTDTRKEVIVLNFFCFNRYNCQLPSANNIHPLFGRAICSIFLETKTSHKKEHVITRFFLFQNPLECSEITHTQSHQASHEDVRNSTDTDTCWNCFRLRGGGHFNCPHGQR